MSATQSQKHVLVLGASGIVGGAVLDLFSRQPGWKVTGVSRRKPDTSSFEKPSAVFDHLSVDLRDTASCVQLKALTTVTHVVYAALYETPGLWQGWSDEAVMEVNRLMLDNTLTPLIQAHAPLVHVTVIHGGKAYGLAAGRTAFPIPLRERDADRQHKSFYWLQEALVQRLAKAHNFHYTIFWPMIIPGGAIAVNMNPVALLGVYGAIRKEEGLPMSYPGPAGLNVTQMTDSRLLAKACLHAAVTETAWDDAFNAINGDVVEWRSAWPAVTRAMGVDAGDREEAVDLAAYIKARGHVWKAVVAKYGLQGPGDVEAYLGESLYYGPMLFTPTPRPIILSAYKLAQTGFTESEDTEESLLYWINNMQKRRLLPMP
jgi:nucleoside-diphosphate-sugar epimerase